MTITSVRRLFRQEIVVRQDLERAPSPAAQELLVRQLAAVREERGRRLAEFARLAFPAEQPLVARLTDLHRLVDIREDQERSWEDVVARLVAGSEQHLQETSRDAQQAGKSARLTLLLVSLAALLISLGLGATVLARIALASRQLAQSEERLRQVIASAPSVLAIFSPTLALTFLSPRGPGLLGRSPEELARDPFCWLRPAESPRLRALLTDTLQGALPAPCELPGQRSDGTAWWAAISLAPTRQPDGTITGVLAQILDVSARRAAEEGRARLEEQLRQAQKMEAIGQLAGGIAHDFNNLLTAITGYSSLARDRRDTTPETRAMLDEVLAAANRATGLTRQLLAFSRKQLITPRPVQLNTTIQGLEKLLTRLLGETITLQCRVDPDLGQCLVDPAQIEQVLLNLTVNARDALTEGGTILIETHNVTLDEGYVSVHPEVTPGEYVQLSVSDDGEGMSREVSARIFEPFFTTKPVGQGTGLGLSMVYGAVRQNKGSIDVYSEPGHGTTFRIYLPRVAAAVPERLQPRPMTVETDGTETILLVEDEGYVRQFASRALTEHGYTVVEAQNGEKALEIFDKGEQKFDLLLTDLILPRMNGRQLADELVRRGQDLPVLFCSGYSDQLLSASWKLDPGVDFLSKPYDARTLLLRVRGILDRRAAAPSPLTTG
ncbi:MAG: ATP-binding protein [Myxococcota bacterium]|nr:ATP-binding protein [Myxococcota bacterium]